MHIHTLDQWQHSHNFSVDRHEAESKTKIVLLLTVITMMAEIGAGIVFGSMALLAIAKRSTNKPSNLRK